jgi:hypothetical protein
MQSREECVGDGNDTEDIRHVGRAEAPEVGLRGRFGVDHDAGAVDEDPAVLDGFSSGAIRVPIQCWQMPIDYSLVRCQHRLARCRSTGGKRRTRRGHPCTA